MNTSETINQSLASVIVQSTNLITVITAHNLADLLLLSLAKSEMY